MKENYVHFKLNWVNNRDEKTTLKIIKKLTWRFYFSRL